MFGWRLVRVSGHSMSPVLEDGDYVVLKRVRRQSALKPGEIVLIRHAEFGDILKRIRRLGPNGIEAEGISDASVSSEKIGRVAFEHVLGRLIWRIGPGGVSKPSFPTLDDPA